MTQCGPRSVCAGLTGRQAYRRAWCVARTAFFLGGSVPLAEETAPVVHLPKPRVEEAIEFMSGGMSGA
jgi:hypothetical protein